MAYRAALNGTTGAQKQGVIFRFCSKDGVAATKVVSSPSEVAVFGIAATEDGVVAGQAVATDAGAAVVDAVVTPADADDADEAAADQEEDKPSDS